VKPGVRVSGGMFRGRPLRVPAGARPTSGRVREALFSIWGERIRGARVLDLFAGSGIIGLEAAGRGALRVLSVDVDRGAIKAIGANAALLGESLLEARCLELPAGLARLADGGSFDLVYADPPYAFPELEEVLTGVKPLLASDGEVVVEHSTRRAMPEEHAGLIRAEIRRYGESTLSFYRVAPL
jgi:16S rRNA (guanine966-N2)-methyltransferase